ncbi:MAG: carbamoyl phosphate synthase small subunit, partial [Oscillospiraceae bacterium]
SSTRNVGIDVSTGDYIMHVDGDDFINKDTIENMVAKIINSKENIDELLNKINQYSISGAVEAVTTKSVEIIDCENTKYNVVAVDYGFSRNMLKALTKRGCKVTIVPAYSSADEIASYSPDGILLSDGPADPDDNLKLIDIIKELTGKNTPLFCLGLGHQMIALAVGGKVKKMPRGHRGSNQPVRILGTDKIMVTTQNHGYTVDKDSIEKSIADEWLTNVNDGSVEGIKFKSFKGLAVQFIPTDVDGFCDNSWIYDEFIALMGGNHVE